MADHDVWVQVRYVLTDKQHGEFADALWFPLDEWPVDGAALEAQKQERFADWKDRLTAAAVEPVAEPATEPTADDRGAQAADLVDRAKDLVAQAQAIADSFTAEAPADGA